MEWLTRRALDRPRTTLIVVALLASLAAAGLPRIAIEVGYRGILGDAHPSVRRLEAFIERFGGGLPISAVYSCEETALCESVFDESALAMAQSVEEGIRAHPLVRRVDSPASSPLLAPAPGGFEVRRLVEEGRIAPDREALRDRALADALWQGTLVSPDGRVGAIVVQLASSDSRTTWTVVPALQEILAPFELRGFRFHLVGDPVDFAVAGGELQRETPRIAPVMVLLVAAIVFALFRSWRITLAALATSGLAVLLALGSMGWLGWPQSELTQALAPAILVIGICATIHVLARYASGSRSGADTPDERRALLLRVTGEVGAPCFIAALTTAAGFLSFSTSGFASFLRFGVIAALGVMAALLLTFSLLPVLLVRIRPEAVGNQRLSETWDRALGVLIGVAERRGAFILTVAGILLFVCGLGVSRLEVDVDERELFGESNPVVRWAEFVEQNLRRSDTLEIELTAPAGTSALEPSALARVGRIVDFLPTVEGLGRVRSILDPLRRIHQALRDDDPAQHRVGDDRAANRQLLLVLRLDDATDPDSWIDPSEQSVRISVEADPLSKSERTAILEAVTAHLRDALPAGWRFEFTGPFSLYLDLVREMQRTQLRSFGAAAAVISLLFWIFLWATGSPAGTALRWTAIGMVATGLPVVATLGAMGLWGIHLDVGTIMVGAIVLGIAVDDTIHLVAHYRFERNAGAPEADALETAIRRVGRAVVTTSIALALGFFALTLSSWQSIASFGLLSGIAILAALAADLFVLPCLILGFQPATSRPERQVVSGSLPRRGRGLLGALVLTTSGAMLWAALSEGTTPSDPRPGCRWLSSGYVLPPGSLDPSCPLVAFERIELLELPAGRFHPQDAEALHAALGSGTGPLRARVRRAGVQSWIELPFANSVGPTPLLRIAGAGLVAGSLAALALFLLAYSSAPAAAPFSAVAGCLAVLTVDGLCGALAGLPAWPALLALGLAPAATAHVALGFPRPAGLLASAPGVARVLYLAAALCAGILVWGAERYPVLCQAASAASASLVGLIWLLLLGKCALRLGESPVGLERARANAVVVGSGVALAALAGLRFAVREVGGSDLLVATLAGAALPLPLGYALARYQLNDVRPHVRQVVSYALLNLIFAGALATLAALAFPHLGRRLLTHPIPALAFLTAALLSAGLLRDALWNGLRRGIPTLGARLRSLEGHLAEQLGVLREPEEIATLTAHALRSGLKASWVTVFLRGQAGWRPAASLGVRGVVAPETARTAARACRSVDPVHFALEGGAGGELADRLRARGIELAAPLRSAAEPLGIALLGPPVDRLPYTRGEIAFAGAIASRAAVAIHRSRLADELLQAERSEALAQIAAGLAHDLGKPLSVAYQRARAMKHGSCSPEDVRRHAESIASLTDEALSTLDRLVAEGREGLRPSTGSRPLAEVITRSAQAAERLHGEQRVAVRITPGLPRVAAGRDLEVVLLNLLDNALWASPAAPVEIYAVLREPDLTVEVIDRGCGMDAPTLERAFTPYFTTRPRQGGRGIGLAASRAIVEQLGGTIELESEPGAGTRARIRIPREVQTG